MEESRAAIVAVGRELFGAYGYAHTSLTDVARAANVTKGAVFHHFGSKEGLFRCVYDAVELEVQLRIQAEAAREASAIGAVRCLVSAYLDVVMDPAVQRILLIDASSVLGPDAGGPLQQQPGYADFANVIRRAVDAGDIRPVDPDGIAIVVRGACVQAGLHIARSEDQGQARRLVGAALDVLLSGLSIQAPTPSDVV